MKGRHLVNERPRKKLHLMAQTNTHTDMATLRPTWPTGAELVKILKNAIFPKSKIQNYPKNSQIPPKKRNNEQNERHKMLKIRVCSTNTKLIREWLKKSLTGTAPPLFFENCDGLRLFFFFLLFSD